MKKLALFSFTTAEVVVIVLTLLVVSWLSWWNFEKSQKLQRDLNRKADLAIISQALQSYYQLHGIYPKNSTDFMIIGCGSEGDWVCYWNRKWEDREYIYLDLLPSDQQTFAGLDWPEYGYQASEDQSVYRLWAFLEREKDPEILSSQKGCSGSWQKNQYLLCP